MGDGPGLSWSCMFCGCRINGIPTWETCIEIGAAHACPQSQKQGEQITEMHRIMTALSRKFTEKFGVEQPAG